MNARGERRGVSPPLLIILAAGLAGGCDAASPYRSALRDQARALEEMALNLEKVGDANSMKTARKQLALRYDEYESVRERAARLPPPSPEIVQQVLADGEKLKEALQKVQDQVRRIHALPAGPEFLQGFDNMQGFLGDSVR